MKTIIFVLVLVFVSSHAYSQDSRYFFYGIDFEDTTQNYRLVFENNLYRDNIWQIGVPVKSYFTESNTGQRAICTDTARTYPPNDTSVFLIEHLPQGGLMDKHTFNVSGYYKVDCDTLLDFGKIEFSPNNGVDWIDLLDNDIGSEYMWWDTDIPVLTGKSDWSYFRVEMPGIGYLYDILDTVLFKFSFISDEIDNQRDGLMFDDFYFNDESEGIDNVNSDRVNVSVYPNPSSSGCITFRIGRSTYAEYNLKIVRSDGKIIDSYSEIREDKLYFKNLSEVPGIFFYILTNKLNATVSTGSFIIQ